MVKLLTIEQLQRWFDEEKARGLVDVKFFAGRSSDALVRDIAAEVLDLVHGRTECTDVTDQKL